MRKPRARVAVACGLVASVGLAALSPLACGGDSKRREATCDGKQVDLASDRANCGACAQTCKLSQACIDGECGCTVKSCSACDPACPYGLMCVSGECKPDPRAQDAGK